MTLDQAYNYFPYFIFIYGLVLYFTLSSEHLEKVAGGLSNNIWPYLQSHKPIAAVGVILGGLWILQRLWIA